MDEKCGPVPATWQTVVSEQNHTELAYINKRTKEAGAEDVPFKWVEPLPEDNGEQFFSDYLEVRKEIEEQGYTKMPYGQCPCWKCGLQPPPVAAAINQNHKSAPVMIQQTNLDMTTTLNLAAQP